MTGIGTQLIGWEHPERWLDWRGPKVFSPEEDWSCPECLTARVRGGGKILLHHWIGLNEALGLIAGPRQKSGQNHLQTRSEPRNQTRTVLHSLPGSHASSCVDSQQKSRVWTATGLRSASSFSRNPVATSNGETGATYDGDVHGRRCS